MYTRLPGSGRNRGQLVDKHIYPYPENRRLKLLTSERNCVGDTYVLLDVHILLTSLANALIRLPRIRLDGLISLLHRSSHKYSSKGRVLARP